MPSSIQKPNLKLYPELAAEISKFANTAIHEFIEELSPLIRMISKEAVSEGNEEIIQRVDGSTVTMSFKDVEVSLLASREIEIDTDLDEWIMAIHNLSQQMVNHMEGELLESVGKAAEENGNVFSAEELKLEVIVEMLEKSDLTFNEQGEMQQVFVIPPALQAKFNEIWNSTEIQELIERKRREYFAKKGD